MSDWLISLEGTSAGQNLALALALTAAFLHAVFGALQKGRHDPCVGIRAGVTLESRLAIELMNAVLMHQAGKVKTEHHDLF